MKILIVNFPSKQFFYKPKVKSFLYCLLLLLLLSFFDGYPLGLTKHRVFLIILSKLKWVWPLQKYFTFGFINASSSLAKATLMGLLLYASAINWYEGKWWDIIIMFLLLFSLMVLDNHLTFSIWRLLVVLVVISSPSVSYILW